MPGGQHPFHNKTVKLFQIQKIMMVSLKASEGKKIIPISLSWNSLKKKKGGRQPPTLCEATALPKLGIINRFENISSLSQSHIWQR